MSAPTATYWAKPDGLGAYTLRVEMNDEFGVAEITSYGCSPERCLSEVNALRSMGYEVTSKVYGKGRRDGKQG